MIFIIGTYIQSQTVFWLIIFSNRRSAPLIPQPTLTPERKQELLDQLSVGDALHKKAHREGDMFIMEESLGIIDGIKAQTSSLEVD